MNLAIPRGIIYHSVLDDLKWLVTSLVAKLDDQPVVAAFETRFAQLLGRKHCVAFPFARTAIYYALKRQHFPHGSEIIMPPISIKGILDVVLALGLVPVFVDIDKDTLCFDEQLLEKALNANTRAVIITYLFGMVPDVEKLVAVCRRRGVFVIEDFSQCLNGQFADRKIGSFGEVGVYSASSIKTLDTYGGGLLVCDDEALAEALRADQAQLAPPVRTQLWQKIVTDLIRNVATTRLVFHFGVFPLLGLLAKLKPNSVLKHTGDRDKAMIDELPGEWFCAYTALQARVGLEGLVSLEALDQERLHNVAEIKAAAPAVDFPRGSTGGVPIYWQLLAYFADPAATQQRWHGKKIDTATTSLLKISDLPAYPYHGDTPNADKLYSNSLFIPCFPGLNAADRQRIIQVLNDVG
ncbi:DegT/DnrJ/EryC1/StrS family aminotransferase [Methylovulum psychrotolerans]|uniref:Aminotransferase DegT n=1 Tax=Methylovulum psychrotolerans TaxID=1704499 RepID=A0A1Z4BUJ1_9GAMM|nr:DegT/DnrJ/EryC1/StrS aminotransferase family protein [Methylovulum psychrotolerans]ASF44928.1 hypothetical protein CEK71_01960 [Methylovulum psychrotolerans]